jgi:hypothetical protein
MEQSDKRLSVRQEVGQLGCPLVDLLFKARLNGQFYERLSAILEVGHGSGT